MKRLYFLLIAPLLAPLWAQPSGLGVVGTTSTQIVISYRAPNDDPCTVAAVNLGDPEVIVYDLDFTKFPGSPAVNTDFRHSWNVASRSRYFVLGKRTSDAANDGKLVSRALETSALHRITVTCAGVPGTLEVTTSGPPTGATFPEGPPRNPAGLGSYAWPSIDWTDRARPHIDPMTGVKIKFATFPGDYSNKTTGLFGSDLWVDYSSGFWVDPQNAASGNTSVLAGYSSFGNEALFVGVDPALTVSNRLYGGWGGGEAPWSTDDLGVHVIGSGTDANDANRTVSLCLSIDSGQSCYTNSFTVILPRDNPADLGVLPPNFPTPIFGGWGKAVMRSQLPTSGTANVSGQTMTLTSFATGANLFNPDLTPGSKIRVPGSNPVCGHNLCTLDRVVDGTQLLLLENFATPLNGVSFTIANFGVRILKTTPSGSVSVSLRYENAWSFGAMMPVSGATEMCSRIPVQVSVDRLGQPLANGQVLTGYNCAIDGAWYWISTDTGESRLITLTVPPPNSAFPGVPAADIPFPAQPPPGVAAFDATDGNTGYVFASLQNGGKALFKLTYTGDYRALNYHYPTGGGGEMPINVEQNVTWTNLSPISQGQDLATQIQIHAPGYDAARFGQVTDFYGISGKYAVFLKYLGGQDTPCWVFIYNLQTHGLEQGFNTFDGTFNPLMRWAACHSGGPSVIPDAMFLAMKPLNAQATFLNYGGPYVANPTHVLRVGGTFDTNTAVAPDPDGSYEATCPGGLTGEYSALTGTNQCLTIRVAGEACSAVATANEKLWSPCPTDANKGMLQPMAVGDSMTNPDIGSDSQRYVIVKKTVLSPSSIELVLKRELRVDCGTLAAQRTNANGWRAIMAPNGNNTCEVGIWVLDVPTLQLQEEHARIIRGHFDFGVGTTPSTYTLIGQGFNGPAWSYVIRDNTTLATIGQPADIFVAMDKRFSGVAGLSFGALQSYVSKHQWTAPEPERRWALDFRHLNGSFGIFGESTGTSLGPVTTTPVAGTAHVYQISVLGGVNVKKIPLLGFAGRNLLREKSSPALGNTLTDSDPYQFCYAYRDGECRTGSTAGQAFVSLPSATLTGQCQTAQFARNIPCLMTNHPLGAWAVQFDTAQQDSTGPGIRRLTMGLTGPGRQYAFGNLRALPDGKWALMSGWWIDGARNDVMLVKLPRFEETDRANRQDFTPLSVSVGTLIGGERAIVDFGYAEYGDPLDFYCTPRAEACSVSGGTLDYANPFQYASESSTGLACSPGCTIQVPVLPGRVVYYRVRFLNGSGQTVRTLRLQIRASAEIG